MKNKNISRRNLFKYAVGSVPFMGIASHPFNLLLTSIISGISHRAHAQMNGTGNPMNFVHISMDGGPARWMFDLSLKPNGNDNFMNAPMLISQFDNFTPGSIAASYATTNIGSYYLPYIWSQVVPGTSVDRSMSDLAQNMLMIRGAELLTDGHQVNRVKAVQPVAGSPSLHGLVADKSTTPIPAISYGGWAMDPTLGFSSQKGLGIVRVEGSNPMPDIMRPFDIGASGMSFGNIDIAASIDNALDIIKMNGKYSSAKVKSLFNDRYSAKQLIEKGVSALNDQFNLTIAKYELLVQRSLNEHTFSNIDAQALMTENSSLFKIDGGNIFIPDAGQDLRSAINTNTTIGYLANTMALTEILLKEELSSSITLTLDSLQNLQLQYQGMNQYFQFRNDSHDSGAYSTLFFYSKYYKAISSCLLELITVLKNDMHRGYSLFNDSVIHLASEFGRSARFDGTGADHGWEGTATSIFSGKITQPLIAGNIRYGGTGGNYRGTWGAAGTTLNNRKLNNGNIISSISTLLDITSPTANDQSLIRMQNGAAVSNLGDPQNV